MSATHNWFGSVTTMIRVQFGKTPNRRRFPSSRHCDGDCAHGVHVHTSVILFSCGGPSNLGA